MSNSSLVDYTKISPNKTSPRNHAIDTITIHCYVGQVSVESMAGWFGNPSSKAAPNYGIGTDGRIALFVEEKDRSWCTSSASNDNRAITIECASDTVHPYAINNNVYDSLIDLCADICKRNGIKELKWINDKSLIGDVSKQNITVHRWFKNKACPGEYIFNRLGQIADEVNAKLGKKKEDPKPAPTPVKSKYPKVPFNVQVKIDNLNYRKTPSSSSQPLGKTGQGTFGIVEVNGDWGKLKSGAGWIYLANPNYVTVIYSGSGATERSVKVNIKNLNIRTGPGTYYNTTGKFTGIGIFTIVEEKNGWGRLKSGAGWINLSYTEKV